jgi:microcin C transport system permease protein
MIPTFLGIVIICFTLTRFLPGGPVEQYIAKSKSGKGGESSRSSGKQGAISPEQLKKINEYYGFDKPIWESFCIWIFKDLMGLNSDSFSYTNKKVYQLISERLPISLMFGLTGFILTYLICIPLGIAKALRDGTAFDLSTSLWVFIGYSLPPFAFGMLLKFCFCGSSDHFFDILPATGYYSNYYDTLSSWGKFIDVTKHMFLPVTCYVIGNFAVTTILMKNSLMEQISQDYIRTVIARGGKFKVAIWGHALRNALVPIATGFGGILTVMFAGSVVIERIFEIPGMGKLSLEAISGRDYPIFMGILALTTILGMFGTLFSDFCYMLIDPRINFDK